MSRSPQVTWLLRGILLANVALMLLPVAGVVLAPLRNPVVGWVVSGIVVVTAAAHAHRLGRSAAGWGLAVLAAPWAAFAILRGIVAVAPGSLRLLHPVLAVAAALPSLLLALRKPRLEARQAGVPTHLAAVAVPAPSRDVTLGDPVLAQLAAQLKAKGTSDAELERMSEFARSVAQGLHDEKHRR